MLVRALASVWARMAAVPQVDTDPATEHWLHRLASAEPKQILDAAIEGPPEQVVAAVRTLLTRASTAARDDPKLPLADGALLSRIVARGHGTDFDGGALVEAHGHFLHGTERHLRAPEEARRYYQLARLAYNDADARPLAHLATFASATVERTLLTEADDTEVRRALHALGMDDSATAAYLNAALEPYIKAVTLVARARENALDVDIAVDSEGAELLRWAAQKGDFKLEVALPLARLADDHPARQGERSVRQELAANLMLHRRWQDAVDVLAEVLAEDPANRRAIAGIAYAYTELGRWPESRQLLTGALHEPLEVDDVPILRQLVMLGYAAHDAQADTWRRRLLMLDPNADPTPAPPDRRQSIAPLLASFRDGQLQLSANWTQVPPDEQRAQIMAAIVAANPKGHYVLRRLIQDDAPLADRVVTLLGWSGLSAQKVEARVHFDAGEKYFADRHFNEAQREYQEALNLDSTYVEAATYLADTWYRRGAYHLAQAFFEESLAIRPTAMAHRFLGDSILWGGHGARRARDAYRRALDLDPNYAGAREALAHLSEEPEGPRTTEATAPERARTAPVAATSSVDPLDQTADLPPAPAEAEMGASSVGDRVLAGYVRMSGRERDGIADVVDDDERFATWLGSASLPEIVGAIELASMLAFHYEVKDRDTNKWTLWVRRELAMAEALPRKYGPTDDPAELGRDRRLANALSGLAAVQINEGWLSEARSLYERALAHLDAEQRARDLAGLSGEPKYDRIFSATSVRGNWLSRLAAVCAQLGDRRSAYSHQQEAERLNTERPTLEAEVDRILAYGRAALRDGQTNEALGAIQHALYIVEDGDPDPITPRMVTKALNGLGEAYRVVGATRAALKHLQRACQLNEQNGNSDRLAYDHRSIARVLEVRPDVGTEGLGDARHHLEQALVYASIADTEGSVPRWIASNGASYRIVAPDRAWPTLLQIAALLQREGDDEAAVQYLDMATNIADLVRAGVLGEQERIAVRTEQVEAFARLSSAHIRLAQKHTLHAAEHVRAAWLANESLRARTFLDALGNGRLTLPPSIPVRLVDRERELMRRREELRASRDSGADFWGHYREVTDELDVLWGHLRKMHPEAAGYVDIREAAPADPDDLLDILRGDGRAVVLADICRVDDERIGVLALRPDHDEPILQTYPVNIRRLNRFIHQNFGSSGSVRELATDMEDVFQYELSSVAQLLTAISDAGDVLIVSPFGALHHVPLGALRPDGQLLLERNPVACLPNSSLLRALRAASHEAPARTAAVFGDPTGDLEGARAEASAVARRFGVSAVLGIDASVQRLSKAFTQAGVLHVAAHAAFDPVDPLASGVVLADGRLTAREILALRAPALSLVTLSACDTGVNKNDAAEELVGFSRALLFAGADSILVSLWKVPDTPTLDVMDGFYAASAAGQPKVDALRAAVLTARDCHGPERFDRWGGFQLIGDWR